MTRTSKRWEVDRPRGDLRLVDARLPDPARAEVTVQVDAVSLNYRDAMMLDNDRGIALDYPFTPASDLAGTVIDVGPGAERFAVGDRVISVFTPDWLDGRRPGTARTPWYRTLGGQYPGVLARHVNLGEHALVSAPRTLSADEASTLPCAGLTAWFALAETGRVQSGQTVLIEGTGGVSLFGLQVAKMHGATVVLVGSPAKFDAARRLGADHVLDRHRDWLEPLHELTGDRGVDHVLEVVGGSNFGRAAHAVAVGGHIHLIGSLGGFDVSSDVMPLLLKNVTVHGTATGHRAALERFVSAVDATGSKPVIDTVYDFERVPDAFTQLRRGATGKIVVAVG